MEKEKKLKGADLFPRIEPGEGVVGMDVDLGAVEPGGVHAEVAHEDVLVGGVLPPRLAPLVLHGEIPVLHLRVLLVPLVLLELQPLQVLDDALHVADPAGVRPVVHQEVAILFHFFHVGTGKKKSISSKGLVAINSTATPLIYTSEFLSFFDFFLFKLHSRFNFILSTKHYFNFVLSLIYSLLNF